MTQGETRGTTGGGHEAFRFALAAAEMAANTRCTSVIVLDLRGRSPVTEFFVIATGTSAVQMRTVADEISDLGERMGYRKFQSSGYEGAKWIVVDFVHVVGHVFDPAARDFYDLETLWGDAPRIDWRRELGLPPARPEEEVSFERRMAGAAGQDEADAAEEEARMEGRDAGEEGDADIDEEAESDAPVVVELPDLSSGSNSVEFVEVDPPATRRQRGKAVYPTPLKEEDDEGERNRGGGRGSPRGGGRVERDSLDEDDAERASEAAADRDPEAVSDEDLPDERMESKPMGGVSAGMSSTLIEEDDEDQQRQSHDRADAEQGHRDEIPPAHESAAESVTIRKADSSGPAIDLSSEMESSRPGGRGGRRLPNRKAMRAPTRSAPGPVNLKKAKAGVVKPVRKAASKGRAATAKKAKKAARPSSRKAAPARKPAAKKKAKPARKPASKAKPKIARKPAARKRATRKAAAKRPATRKARRR